MATSTRAPVDPRLLRLIPPVRPLIIRAGVAQALTTVLVLARGVLLGWAAAQPITGEPFPWWTLPVLGAVIAAHGGVAWLAQHWSDRGVGDTIDTLRTAALHALRHRDPRAVQEQSGHWRTVLTTGLEDFRPYLSEFLPALVSVVLATPAALLVVFPADPVSGVLALVTVPLIPVFMVLIGTLTRARTQRRLRITLRALDATEGPAREVESGGRRHADSTMSVLRLAFLSSFSLEFIATLSVATVATRIVLGAVGRVAWAAAQGQIFRPE